MSPKTEIAALELQISHLKQQIRAFGIPPAAFPYHGCSDNSCLVSKPAVGTNGGCRCIDSELRRAVIWLRQWAEFQAATLQSQRNEIGRLETELAERHEHK